MSLISDWVRSHRVLGMLTTWVLAKTLWNLIRQEMIINFLRLILVVIIVLLRLLSLLQRWRDAIFNIAFIYLILAAFVTSLGWSLDCHWVAFRSNFRNLDFIILVIIVWVNVCSNIIFILTLLGFSCYLKREFIPRRWNIGIFYRRGYYSKILSSVNILY